MLLSSSSNRKYQPYPSSYFSVVVCLRCLLHHILSLIAYTFRENRYFVLIIRLWWVQIFGYVLACRSWSFACTLHSLTIIIVQTYLRTLDLRNACQIYFVECVSKIKHIFSVIHYTIYGAVFFFSLTIPLVVIDRIYTLSYFIIKSEVWTFIHCLGLGLETMVCVVCLFIFLIFLFLL